MPSKKPLVVVTRKLPDAVESLMLELFDARLNPADKPVTKSQLIDAVGLASVLVPMPAWTSFQPSARIHRPPIIYYQRAASSY
jgi:hypothetical protein